MIFYIVFFKAKLLPLFEKEGQKFSEMFSFMKTRLSLKIFDEFMVKSILQEMQNMDPEVDSLLPKVFFFLKVS